MKQFRSDYSCYNLQELHLVICWVDLHGRGERLLTERDSACFCASGDRVISTQLCACSYQLFRTWLRLHRNSRKKNGYRSFNSFTFALRCLLGPHDVLRMNDDILRPSHLLSLVLDLLGFGVPEAATSSPCNL